jgi:hypothetical protein
MGEKKFRILEKTYFIRYDRPPCASFAPLELGAHVMPRYS